MTIKENWARLYSFWDELDFERAKAYDERERREIGDTLEYAQQDIQRLEKWASFERELKSASIDAIKDIKTSLGVALPMSFKESLSINAYEPQDQGFVYPWLGSWNVMQNPEEIIKLSMQNREFEWEVFKETNDLIQEDYEMWSDKWVVVFDWNGDYFVALDLREDEEFYGNVLCFCIEDGSIAKWADSYEEWFELVVDEVLQYGQLRISTIENLLSPPRSAFGEIVG